MQMEMLQLGNGSSNNDDVSRRLTHVDDVKLPPLPRDPEYLALDAEARKAIVDIDRAAHYISKHSRYLNPEMLDRKGLWIRRSAERCRRNLLRRYNDIERASKKLDDIIKRLEKKLARAEEELMRVDLHVELLISSADSSEY